MATKNLSKVSTNTMFVYKRALSLEGLSDDVGAWPISAKRVCRGIGSIDDIHAGMIENLFATDLAFLQDLYRRVNQEGHTRAGVTCPACEHSFTVDVAGGRLGES